MAAYGELSMATVSGGFNSYLVGVTSCSPVYDRVVERRRAVALARHLREAEGLSVAQIAERLGRSPATIKAYFYDPS
jgi:AraC-like DNA-binding protein